MRMKISALLAVALLTTMAAEPGIAKNWKNSNYSYSGRNDCNNNTGNRWNRSQSSWNNGRPGWNSGRPDWNRHLYNRAPGGNRWDIDARQARINTQIQRGVTSGRLTPQEMQRLTRMQANIDQRESQYRDSGNRLSMSERARLNAQMNKLSSTLRRELWDRQTH
jgi:hypothetical protein